MKKTDNRRVNGFFNDIRDGLHKRPKAELVNMLVDRALEDDGLLRKLDRGARVVLGLFARKDTVITQEVAAALGLSGRMVRNLVTAWVKDGWLVVSNPSNRARAYRLSATYRKFTGNNPKKQVYCA